MSSEDGEYPEVFPSAKYFDFLEFGWDLARNECGYRSEQISIFGIVFGTI